MRGILIFILAVISISCEQVNDSEIYDYRDSFTGLFNFTTVDYHTSMCYDSLDPDCVNGWMSWNHDTSYYSGIIEKIDSNMLKIVSGEEEIDEYGDSIISQTFRTVITPDGILSNPTFPVGGHYKFEGAYRNFDTLEIYFQIGGLVGGYDVYEVSGIRVN